MKRESFVIRTTALIVGALISIGDVSVNIAIDRFLSSDQQLCKFLGTKESFYMRKQFNHDRPFLVHQHGRRSIILYTNMAAVTSCENDLPPFSPVVLRTAELPCPQLYPFLFISVKLTSIVLSRITFNKFTNSRLGWTKYSDLYEIVHPSLILISLRLLTGA